MGDVFLRTDEQKTVRRLYSLFIEYVKADDLIPFLYSQNAIGYSDKQILDAERVPLQKNKK